MTRNHSNILPGQKYVRDSFHSMKAFDHQHCEYIAKKCADDEQTT